MQEQALVTATEGRYATVRLDKKAQCASCGMCAFPNNVSSIEVRAENKANAAAGDTVLIEKSKNGGLFAALLIFLVPLVLIGLAYVIAAYLIKVEIWILFLSLIFLVSWHTILALIEKRLKKLSGFLPTIVQIIVKGENINGDTGDNERDGVSE